MTSKYCNSCCIDLHEQDKYCHECTSHRIESIPQLPLNFKDRIDNKKYMFGGKIVISKGRVLYCIHDILRINCKDPNCIDLIVYCIHGAPISSCSICAV